MPQCTVLCGVKILVSTAIDSIDIDHGLLDGDDIIKHQTGSWFMVLFSACYESRVFKEVVIVIISNAGSCHVLS